MAIFTYIKKDWAEKNSLLPKGPLQGKMINMEQDQKSWAIFITAILCAVIILIAGFSQKEKPQANLSLYPHELAPHRALYDISLISARSGSQIIDVKGQMMYEFIPDCEGSLTNHQFNMQYFYADQPVTKLKSNFSLYETHDGQELDFITQRKSGNKVFQKFTGHASQKSKEVTFASPTQMTQTLSKDALFPTAHTRELIKAIEKSKTTYNAGLFDGSDLEGSTNTFTVINKAATPVNAQNLNDTIDSALLQSPAHHLQIAFFPENSDQFAAEYEMSSIFHQNGVMRNIKIAYDDFSIQQELIALEALESSCSFQDEGSQIE